MKVKTVLINTEGGNGGKEMYRVTLPKEFVTNNKQIIGKEFKPVMSFTGKNIVLKRV